MLEISPVITAENRDAGGRLVVSVGVLTVAAGISDLVEAVVAVGGAGMRVLALGLSVETLCFSVCVASSGDSAAKKADADGEDGGDDELEALIVVLTVRETDALKSSDVDDSIFPVI